MAVGRRTAALGLVCVLLLATGCMETADDLPGERDAAGSVSATASATASAPASASAPPSASATALQSSPPTGPGASALFFGDSYFIGANYTGPDDSMAAVAADRLGWDRRIAGGGGTGFVTGNHEYGLDNFMGQIQNGALDVGPVDWLVIEGGGADKLEDPALIERSAVQVLNEARAWHPEAQVVLVSTLDPTVDDFSDTDGVVAALDAAADRVGVPYIVAQRWLEGHQDLVGPDLIHPLWEGHQLLGRKLAQALRALAPPA